MHLKRVAHHRNLNNLALHFLKKEEILFVFLLPFDLKRKICLHLASIQVATHRVCFYVSFYYLLWFLYFNTWHISQLCWKALFVFKLIFYYLFPGCYIYLNVYQHSWTGETFPARFFFFFKRHLISGREDKKKERSDIKGACWIACIGPLLSKCLYLWLFIYK